MKLDYSYDHEILYFEVIKQTDEMLSSNEKLKKIIIFRNHSVVIDIFVANNCNYQK